MEENVALDSSKQRKFVKSIKGIKKLIKRKNDHVKPPTPSVKDQGVKEGRVYKKKPKQKRGLVYLSHIPHGFYEHEMTEYFKQFGAVTNTRVIRSKRSGASKGHAFVEFREPSVAQIVADTMNNYLMGKRLLKAAYIPPEKQRFARRMNWTAVNNPAANRRIAMKKAHNADRDEQGELKRVKKILSNLSKTKKKLQELGINYDFFTPVDMPEALLNIKQEQDNSKDTYKQTNSENENKVKKVNKPKDEQKQSNKDKKTVRKDSVPKILKPEVQTQKQEKSKKGKTQKISETQKNQDTTNDKKMKDQKQKMLSKGMTPLEEFVKIQPDSESGDDSEGSDFDSDAFEKMMNSDDEEFDSNDDHSEEQSDDDESDEKDEPVQIQVKNKGKVSKKVIRKPTPQTQKGIDKPQKKAIGQKLKPSPQKKFEKQATQKPRNKQFKKKK